jgi:hypothetical protein
MKPVKSVILFFCVSLVCACEHLYTILPETDIDSYRTDSGFSFPPGTSALDIYNCLSSVENKDITVTPEGYSCSLHVAGTLKHTVQATLNGVLQEPPSTDTKDIQSVKLTYSEYAPQIHESAVIVHFKDNTEYRLCYKWQRETTNVWQNDKIASAENSAPLKDTTGLWQKDEITSSDVLTIQLL